MKIPIRSPAASGARPDAATPMPKSATMKSTAEGATARARSDTNPDRSRHVDGAAAARPTAANPMPQSGSSHPPVSYASPR